MSLSRLFHKLHRVNKRHYKQMGGCITFANILVSSFFAILFSDFIQSTLPEGGDSRKQIYLIFALAVVGCFIFTLYASGLFLRHKSKEIGVFLALGADKSKLTRALHREMFSISMGAALFGITIGNIFALVAGKVFQFMALDEEKKVFSLSLIGIMFALIFVAFVFLFLLVMSLSFMKKSNVIDILNAQRKSEPIKKNVGVNYLISGIIMFAAGILLAAILPKIYVTMFKQYLSGLFNLFYILCVLGLYRVLIYSIVVHKRRKNPQKYYKNLISYGMLKFQGISMVRNMGLITLLIMGSLYAAFYLPSNIMTGNSLIQNNPVDVAYRVPESAEGFTEKEVEELAGTYGLQIEKYRELEFLELLSSGINRDNVDESGKIVEVYEQEAYYRQFISDSIINSMMGTSISVERGTYKMICTQDMSESILFAYDDLDHVKNTETGIEKELKYAGNENFNELVVDNGWDTFARFIISEADYEELKIGIADAHIIKQTLFNVNNLEKSYGFSKELFEEYCLKAETDMKVLLFHDSYMEQKAIDNGEEYMEAQRIELQPKHPEIELNWKYAPYFKMLFQKNILLQYAVQYLLFGYVAIVMLAAVGIIAYTRSQSIGNSNKQVYEDVRKLGANNKYILHCIKGQLKKVYLLPTAIGITIIYLYQIMIMYQNDGKYTKAEGKAAVICLLLCLGVVIFQYVGYKISLKEVKRIMAIKDSTLN